MTAATVRTVDDLIRDVHPHIAELTYVDNMPWLGTMVRTVAGHVIDGIPVTERMLDIALVGAERDHRAADTGRDPLADAPRLERAPTRTRRRGAIDDAVARTRGAETVTGVVAYRGRRRGVVSVRIEIVDRGFFWLNWPAAGDTVRPGDTVTVTGTVREPAGIEDGRVTRVSTARRTARPHEQHDR